jgi:hypothetical protein
MRRNVGYWTVAIDRYGCYLKFEFAPQNQVDLDTVEAIKNRVLECYGFLPLSPYLVDIFTVIESRNAASADGT